MGNSMEEGILLQINNPTHTSVGRVSVSSAAVSAVVFFVATNFYFPEVKFPIALSSSIVLFCIVGIFVHRWVISKRVENEAKVLEYRRLEQQREAERRIAEMKQKGTL